MKELTLSELREIYPSIKATSKKRFLELVAEQQESVDDLAALEADGVENEYLASQKNVNDFKESKSDKITQGLNTDELTWYNIVDYILSESKSNKKILIKTESTFDADFLFQHLKEKLFPVLEESNTVLMASSTRRDIHMNGSCYVRLVCQANYTHIKRLIAYNTFKTVVN